MPGPESQSYIPSPNIPREQIRDVLYLAEQASGAGLKVFPSDQWGLHYPVDANGRSALIQALLKGETVDGEPVNQLRPDALLYNISDIGALGTTGMGVRIRDLSVHVGQYDYQKFVSFLSGMAGVEISVSTAQEVYNAVAQDRTRQKMLDSYGFTGKRQVLDLLKAEAAEDTANLADMSRQDKILTGLSMEWLSQDLSAVSVEERENFFQQFSEEERQLVGDLAESYRKYVKMGKEDDFKSLVGALKDKIDQFNEPDQVVQPEDTLDSELKEELADYLDKIGPPGTPEDSAIPPDDQDEYHTSSETVKPGIFFEITPAGTSEKPLIGYYASGRKSYFDIDSKTWSKQKATSPYDQVIDGDARQTISGKIDGGLKAIPIPAGYAIDVASLKYSGAQPMILRDQNGCFYIQGSGESTFSVDFLKEALPFESLPTDEDLKLLHKGTLDQKTEEFLANLSGDALTMAQQIRAFMLSDHFYPAGGDLQYAQALQLKLREQSTGDDYIQNLEKSLFLECYSANTLFIAMARKMGIPARLVQGDYIKDIKDGKALIDTTTGHAWAEVWDGSSWRRVDSTPNPRKEDMKDDQKQDQSQEGEMADDGGVEKEPDQSGEGESGDSGEQGEPGEDGQPGGEGQGGKPSKSGKRKRGGVSDMDEVSDSQMREGTEKFNKAGEEMDQISKQKRTMDQQAEEADSFKKLEELMEQAQDADMFEDMKEEVKKRLEAKEQMMKDEVQKRIDELSEAGFIDEERAEALEKELTSSDLDVLDSLRNAIDREGRAYDEFLEVREEVTPYVEQWYKFFAEKLPKQDEIEMDEDSLTRQGALNRHSIMRARNLLFGTVKNPRTITPSMKPKFLATILVDVSRSMGLDPTLQVVDTTKIHAARKLLVFYNELFSRISGEFGYIRYAVNLFSDQVTEIKGFDQDYESPERYQFDGSSPSTIKVRLMEQVRTQRGTNILDAVKKVSGQLNEEAYQFPDWASSFYFVGDGEDSYHQEAAIKQFIDTLDPKHGFGDHMLSAVMLGDENLRQKLADIFGEEHISVASDFDSLVEQSMLKFDEDMEAYFRGKTR